jgi:AcrR family transcriptional regulator
MAPASLYSYFDSKHALYDAMFADGNRVLLAQSPPLASTCVRRCATSSISSWTSRWPTRSATNCSRSGRRFEPSAEAYALAGQAYERITEPLRQVADVTQDDLDLITAVITGLINQQLANEPGGTRWVRLVDDAVDLLVPRLQNRAKIPAPARGRSRRRSADS